jgi:hypothetical protein
VNARRGAREWRPTSLEIQAQASHNPPPHEHTTTTRQTQPRAYRAPASPWRDGF